jgi:hypothetical protein
LNRELENAEVVFSLSFVAREDVNSELQKFAESSSLKSTIDVTI